MATQSASPVWTLLNALRASGLPADRIAYLLATLILLRWADFQDAEEEAMAAFEDQPYQPALDPSFHWRSWSHLVGEDLRQRLDDIKVGLDLSRPNPSTAQPALAFVWDGIHDLTEIDEGSRTGLVRWLADQPFETPADRLDLLRQFDALLDASTSKATGQFRTPSSICELMVGLVAPRAGESVYDPCFGSAGLLTASVEYVNEAISKSGRARGETALRISGVELNLHMFVIGFARLLLSGVADPQLVLGNSLERDHKLNPTDAGFDVALANPPFGGKVDLMGLGHLPVQTSDVTALFIQHTLGQLKPGGRAAIVVPQGLLFRGGVDRQFRRWLIESNALEAVVSLGNGAFLPYAGIQASILLLRRGDRLTRTRFVDAESLFDRTREAKSKALSEAAIAQIVEAVKSSVPTDIAWDQSIQEIAHLEWDLTPKRRGQSDFHSVLDSIAKKMPVLPLGDLASISTGISVKSQEILSEPTEGSLPLIRTKDIERGVTSKATSWILPSTRGVSASHKLRGGDILLSKSGTIGKSGIVRNGAIGAIASSGLYVIHVESDQIDPHFLLAYLNSAECQSWLADQATGSTIRHLPIGVLRELPVPIPAQQMQRSIPGHVSDKALASPVSIWPMLMGLARREVLHEWLDIGLWWLPPEDQEVVDPLNFAILERLTGEFESALRQSRHVGALDDSLSEWVSLFRESLRNLNGIRLVPKGASMYAILQDAANALEKATAKLTKSDDKSSRARRLTQIAKRLVDSAIEALAAVVSVSFTSERDIVWSGEYNTVRVEVKNQSVLPLRNLEVITVPDWGSGSEPFLGEAQSTHFDFRGSLASGIDSFELEISWTAETLYGRKVQGTRQVVFEAKEKGTNLVDSSSGLGSSPYVCGDPVRPDRSDVFFGREELLEKIRRTVTRSGNVVLLEGNRRAGKSSILWHLAGPNGVPGWLGVYCSLQGAEGSKDAMGVPTVEVFRVIASSIAKGLHSLGLPTPLPNGAVLQPGGIGIAKACREGISETSPFSDLQEYVEAILEALSPRGLGILLMLDEFDKLQEGIESGVTSPQVPENIRYLIQSYPRFSAILTGSRRMKRLREEYWSALFGLGTREGVTALEESEARRLVIDPVKGRLTYTREAVDHLIRVSACQPFVLQCLCNRVFDLAAELNARTLGLDLVKRASHELIQGWEHFASIWDYAKTDRRRFILALCQRDAKESDPVTLALLREHLAQQGIDVSEAALNEDLEFLRELELLDFDGETDTYSLTLPLMGDWIDIQQDFEVLRTKARTESLDAPEDFSWTPQNETKAQMDMFNVDSEAELEEFLDSWGD